MKKLNKKGFTMVELVIVIAVIAILAGVLIPTFSNVIDKAQESKALQQGRTLYEEILLLDLEDGVQNNVHKVNGVDKSVFLTEGVAEFTTADGVYSYLNGLTVEFEYHYGSYKVTYSESEGWKTAKLG